MFRSIACIRRKVTLFGRAFFITAFVFALTGCVQSASAEDFDATVLEVHDQAVLVEPVAGEKELKSADRIMVSTDSIPLEELPDLEVGMRIRVSYSGTIAESYPAQIHETFAIACVEEIEE